MLQHGSEEISSNLIKRKIAENERARAMSTDTMTPEQAQVLEDERLALLSQNEEFLQVLLRDDDFMKTLERGKFPTSRITPFIYCGMTIVTRHDSERHRARGIVGLNWEAQMERHGGRQRSMGEAQRERHCWR